jgi:benzoylsuccinyl-CoA thiolase BbsB subunit
MRTEVSIEEVLGARPIAYPLTLLMCCPRGDGAAVVVLSSTPPGDARPAVGITALSILSGRYSDGFIDMTRSELSLRTAQAAYKEAGLGPEDIQVVETHDAFASSELFYYEELGFAERGKGWQLIRDGATDLDGTVAVNTSGGLMSRGHPVGATGVAQICEAYWQASGQAGDRQVDGVRNVLTHCTGGGISGFDHGASGVAVVSRQ